MVLALGVTSPVWAHGLDDGEVHASPLSLGEALLIYVGIPLAIIGLIWFLALVPSMIHAPRYRPGLSWWAKPAWFGGPAEGAGAAVDPLAPATQRRGWHQCPLVRRSRRGRATTSPVRSGSPRRRAGCSTRSTSVRSRVIRGRRRRPSMRPWGRGCGQHRAGRGGPGRATARGGDGFVGPAFARRPVVRPGGADDDVAVRSRGPRRGHRQRDAHHGGARAAPAHPAPRPAVDAGSASRSPGNLGGRPGPGAGESGPGRGGSGAGQPSGLAALGLPPGPSTAGPRHPRPPLASLPLIMDCAHAPWFTLNVSSSTGLHS